MIKVEMLIQVCINGRPIWRKAKGMKKELSFLMTDKEYDRVLNAAISQLGMEVKHAQDQIQKEKATV